jgi:hypothetical protein
VSIPEKSQNGNRHTGKNRLLELVRERTARSNGNGKPADAWVDEDVEWVEERDGYIPAADQAFFALSPEEQKAPMLAAFREAVKEVKEERPETSTPAQDEAMVRDLAATMLALSGCPDEEMDFLYEVEPDGSRIAGLSKAVVDLLREAGPEWRMARRPGLVEQIKADCRAIGIVGEERVAMMVYVVGTSRLLERPLAAIVQGRSSSGKSYLVNRVAQLFPAEQVLHAMRITPQALSYYKKLDHLFVVAGERSKVQDDSAADATAMLRQAISEHRISKLVTVKEEGKWTAKHIDLPATIAYVETTTSGAEDIFPEDLNRALLLKTDDSEAQTRAILQQKTARYDATEEGDETAAAKVQSIIEKHQAFQSILKKLPVVIPFAAKLAATIPAQRVEARRVADQIFIVIEAVTLLHQHQRERNAAGHVKATLDDYRVARDLLLAPLGESLGVPTSAERLYDLLAKRYPARQPFTTFDAQKVDTGASESSVRKWLWMLAEHGCAEQVAPARGPKPASWRLCAKTPRDAVLPAPEALEES